MKRAGKLTLSKETLWRMEVQKDSTVIIGGNDSCVQSCYLVSCDGGCGISDGRTD
jgi:hypothetical protein